MQIGPLANRERNANDQAIYKQYQDEITYYANELSRTENLIEIMKTLPGEFKERIEALGLGKRRTWRGGMPWLAQVGHR